MKTRLPSLRAGLTFLGLLCGLAASAAGQATKVYEQRFINKTGANAESATVGWKFYSSNNALGNSTNADGTLTITANTGTQAGISGAVGFESSFSDDDKGFIYMFDSNAARILALANRSVDRDAQEVTKIDYVMRDHANGFAYTTQVVVKVGGQWYVNEQVFDVAKPAPAVTAYTRRSFAWKTTGWKKLTFSPTAAQTLAIAADPAGSLPAGDLEDFGFFAISPGGGSVVIDEVAVWAAPLATETKVYEQRFINKTGANAESATVGWKFYSSNNALGNSTNADGTLTITANTGTQAGISGGVGFESSFSDDDKGFIYMFDSNAARILALANRSVDRDAQEVTKIDYVMRDHANGFAYTTQVVVKVGGQWYVNEQVFDVAKPAPAVTAYTRRSFAWKTTGWKKLTFSPTAAQTLAIAADPAGNLPAGDLEDLGFFAISPGGGSVVIDEVAVYARAGSAAPATVQLRNMSARTQVGAGADVLITGFVLRGAGKTNILVRGVGPSLTGFGVTGVLADPQIIVYRGTTAIGSNNSWTDSQAALQTAFSQVGAFPLSSNLDSAAVLELDPGSYTMHLSGAAGGTGVGLAELYAIGSATDRGLVNLSARALVGTGNRVMIPGFVIGGTQPGPVLIRGIGPSLAQFGVAGVLADPVIEVYDSANRLVASNDNWGTAANLSDLQARTATLGAFALTANSADAALLVTLPPGGYTAVISGKGSATGIALLEVYPITAY